MAEPIYDRVALIGLGLIASSMFWAIRRAGVAREVTGFARSAERTTAWPSEIGPATPVRRPSDARGVTSTGRGS